jgi:hypothetical protein
VSGVTTSIANLNSALTTYQVLRGVSNLDVLKKQGIKLKFALYRELRAIRPPKGSIRSNVLARLKAGKFIRIRESVQKEVRERIVVDNILNHGKILGTRGGKKGRTQLINFGSNNIREDHGQAHWKSRALASQMVEREINVREAGIGFLAVSARYPGGVVDGATSTSRFGPDLARLGIMVDPASALLRFQWLEDTNIARASVRGVTARKGERAIAGAIDSVASDIVTYNQRKLLELGTATLRAMGARP